MTALGAALCITATFMLVEVVCGLLSGSLALLADAAHMLGDAAALGLALLAQRVAQQPGGDRATFGYRRAEVLAAFINGIALAVGALWILREARERWLEPEPIQGPLLLIAASLGLCANLLAAWLLSRSGQGNLNVRAALVHVITDAVGSVGAIVAGVGVTFFEWYRLDPLLSVVIAVLVAYGGWRILRETTEILLDQAPAHLDVEAISRSIIGCSGVASLHDLHVWRISEGFDTLTVHVVLEPGSHGVDVCRRVAQQLRDEFGLDHVTVQPEAPTPNPVVNVRLSRDGPLAK